MIGELTNHLWQSTVFAVAAGLLTVAFRKHRAQVRYWLWLSASFKFFVPLTLLMSLGSRMEWAPAAQKIATQIATPAVSFTMMQIAQPFADTLPLAPSTRGTRDWVAVAILGVWACGFAGVALVRFRGWLRIRAAVRSSIPIEIPATVEVRSSPGLLEPGVVGLLRPILLLPAGIEKHLTPPQLEAVLAHELCHVRRRDNLAAATHMIVETVFWFHPLVWWISARLVEERERACDEEVLSLGSEPQVYAEGIVNVCKLYVESPLGCVSGVTGSDLKKRIEAIMSNRIVLRLNFAKKVALASAGMAALAVPIVVGIMNAPAIRAQLPPPKFEVASIRPSNGCEDSGAGQQKSGDRGERKQKKKGPDPTPGRLSLRCATLGGEFGLILQAYVVFANAQLQRPLPRPEISGGPAWIDSERYDIIATAEGNPSDEMKRGPMLQALLEDRLKLKTHRETREAPVYDLTGATSGPKLQQFKEGSCTPPDLTKPPVWPPPPGVKYCSFLLTVKGPNVIVIAQGRSLDEFSKLLGFALDRPVVDKTGITGKFDFHLEFAIDHSTPRFLAHLDQVASSDGAAGPSILTAVQQKFGMRLDPATGPREFLVIDHVERPSEN